MPTLSQEVTEGVLVTWFVEPGAPVAAGERLAEVQVQKVSSEVSAPIAGRMVELLVAPGGVVAQGAPIAIVEEAAPAAGPFAGPPPASPAARRLAQELGVDLRTIAGSGPGGRIIEADVRAAAPGRPPIAEEKVAALARPAAPRVEPLSPMRRTIAGRLQPWLAATAQLTLTAEADVTDLAARLERLEPGGGRRHGYLEAVVRACALALRDHPRVGARWTDAGLAHPERIDIAIAVALREGLITPVVRGADGKDLGSLAAEIADLAERAQTSRLLPAETEGGVFSVTNLGAYRIDAFTPLLNPPQTAIMGMGRARLRPAVVKGVMEPRMLLVLSLTFDHRVLDGAPAAAFLTEVVGMLEEPGRLLAAVVER